MLDRIQAEGLRTNLALKLTHLGLSIDEELALRNLAELVEHAAQRGNFVRIDMEESRHVDATLRIYRGLRESGHENVGAVLQAYLFRTEADLAALLPLAPNLRLVKGAYLEPPEIAYPRKRDVDAAYVRLLETSLEAGGFTAVATHDETLIEHAISFAHERGIPQERFQFQMLYGIAPPPAARPRPARLRRPGGHAVRAGVVPLPHAPACRAARQPSLSASEPRARLSPSTSRTAIVTSARSRASRYHEYGD